MAAEIGYASTFMAAVLETAGYLTQESILRDLWELLEKTAIVLFILGAIGAVVSLTLFGSYRGIRYLILGPIVFLFLITPGNGSRGVMQKIGDGTPRVQRGEAPSPEAALGEVRRVSTEAEGTGADTSGRPIMIAFPFQLYTQAVSGIMNALVGTILQYENDDDLLFVVKTQALEALTDMEVEDGELISMLQGDMMVSCQKMMDSALALASPAMSKRRENEMLAELQKPENTGNAGNREVQAYYTNALQSLGKSRAEYQTAYDLAKSERFLASDALRRYIVESQGQNGAAKAWLTKEGFGDASQVSSFALRCDDGWSIVEEALLEKSRAILGVIQEKFAGQLKPEDRPLLCLELAEKVGIPLSRRHIDQYRVGNDATGKTVCEQAFGQVAAMFLLRNAIAGRQGSQIVQRIKNRMNLLKGVKQGTTVTLDGPTGDCHPVGSDAGPNGQETRRFVSPDDYSSSFDFRVEKSPDGLRSRVVARYACSGSNQTVERPIAVMEEIAGTHDAALVLHQRWQTAELRQRVFTWAMNFPYYQGLIIYLLCAIYPFMALVTVLPGRSLAFLNFLLAYLWVKSWDVGFALVMVLDKVIWNLFPSVTFDTGVNLESTSSAAPLPLLLSQAFKIDPSFHIHAYYFFLSLAMTSIPVVTAYATLRLRHNSIRALTQPITDSLSGLAKDRAKYAGDTYGMTRMNDMLRYQRELAGTARLSMGFRGEGLEGGLRGVSADAMGQLSAGSQAVRKALPKSTSLEDFVKNFAIAYEEYRPNYEAVRTKFVGLEAKHDAARAKLYHPLLGRAGMYNMMVDATSAAMDGGGGFEINEKDETSAFDALTELVKEKTTLQIDAASNLAAGGLEAAMGIIPGAKPVLGALGTLPGLFEAYAYYHHGKTGGNLLQETDRTIAEKLNLDQYIPQFYEWVRETVKEHPELLGQLELTEEELQKIFSLKPSDARLSEEGEAMIEVNPIRGLLSKPLPDWRGEKRKP